MTGGPVVTLSATYGSGGSRIGPRLAEALGVRFVDRAITVGLAEKLALPESAVEARDDAGPSRFDTFVASIAAIGGMASADATLDIADRSFVSATEDLVREACAGDEGAVVLGRAASVVLRDHPRALHVRLDGPEDRRVDAAMAIEGIDRATAERRLRENDQARCRYVRAFYGHDAADCRLYHLVLDPTRVPEATCVELIAGAARAVVAGAPVS